jgi:hypothetical protein
MAYDYLFQIIDAGKASAADIHTLPSDTNIDKAIEYHLFPSL